MKQLTMMLAVLLIGVTGVHADKDWKKVATLTAGGEAKEVDINQEVSRVMITCTEGSVIVNTVVVREGSKTTPHRVGARINHKESQQIRIGDKLPVTGLRISDDGRGTYVVKIKR